MFKNINKQKIKQNKMEYIKPQLRDVLVDIAQMEEFENCNWRDAAKAVVGTAVTGAVTGCVAGGVAGAIPGCAKGGLVGLVGGALGGAAYYAVTCWW